MIVPDQVLKGMEEESVRFLSASSYAAEADEIDYAVYHFLISGMQVNIHVKETENKLRIFTYLNMNQHHPRISSRFCKVMDSIQQAYEDIVEQEPSLRLKYVTGEYIIHLEK